MRFYQLINERGTVMSTATATNANSLELNQGDQFHLGFDVSASMGTKDCANKTQTRLENLKEKAKVFAEQANTYDPDGADYFTFGEKVQSKGALALDEANKLIDSLQANEMATDTAGLIQASWKRAQEQRAAGITDNIVLMIFTDGAPTNAEAVKTTIRDICKNLENRTEYGIIFLTVGDIDSNLQAFLTDLDDNLNAKDKNGNDIDIVDVKEFASVDFVRAFAGAISD
jgi:hypothetical protein